MVLFALHHILQLIIACTIFIFSPVNCIPLRSNRYEQRRDEDYGNEQSGRLMM